MTTAPPTIVGLAALIEAIRTDPVLRRARWPAQDAALKALAERGYLLLERQWSRDEVVDAAGIVWTLPTAPPDAARIAAGPARDQSLRAALRRFPELATLVPGANALPPPLPSVATAPPATLLQRVWFVLRTVLVFLAVYPPLIFLPGVFTILGIPLLYLFFFVPALLSGATIGLVLVLRAPRFLPLRPATLVMGSAVGFAWMVAWAGLLGFHEVLGGVFGGFGDFSAQCDDCAVAYSVIFVLPLIVAVLGTLAAGAIGTAIACLGTLPRRVLAAY